MGKIVKNLGRAVGKAFGVTQSKDNAEAIQQGAEAQAAAIREASERAAAVAKEQAAIQQKQLQDQQFAANMALQQSVNQRQQAAQMQDALPPPEKQAEVDLAPTTTDTSDPRRKYQSASRSGVAVPGDSGGGISIRVA